MNSNKFYKPNMLTTALSSLYDMQNTWQNKMAPAVPGLDLMPSHRMLNPHYLPASGCHRQQSHYERQFWQIGIPISAAGSTYKVGRFSGGTPGLHRYLYPKTWRDLLRKSQMKRRLNIANLLGSLAFIYSACSMALKYVRKEDDEINRLAAGAITGMLYKSTTGLKNSAIGGSIGLGLAASYYLLHINRIKEYISDKF